MFLNYALDRRYANDRNLLCRAYKILESDVIKVFEYVEPSDVNKATYSHRIYELFLRAATEFESNCKRILEVNGYKITSRTNISDYFKINSATKLSEYKVYLNIWHPNEKKIQPFQEWNNSATLSWYQAYNKVKHNRQTEFNNASLENLINAVAGVYVILYAQFGVFSFNPYHEVNMVDDNENGSISSGESIFSIIPPIWTDNEKYDFDWNTLKNQTNPYDKYKFGMTPKK